MQRGELVERITRADRRISFEQAGLTKMEVQALGSHDVLCAVCKTTQRTYYVVGRMPPVYPHVVGHERAGEKCPGSHRELGRPFLREGG